MDNTVTPVDFPVDTRERPLTPAVAEGATMGSRLSVDSMSLRVQELTPIEESPDLFDMSHHSISLSSLPLPSPDPVVSQDSTSSGSTGSQGKDVGSVSVTSVDEPALDSIRPKRVHPSKIVPPRRKLEFGSPPMPMAGFASTSPGPGNSALGTQALDAQGLESEVDSLMKRPSGSLYGDLVHAQDLIADHLATLTVAEKVRAAAEARCRIVESQAVDSCVTAMNRIAGYQDSAHYLRVAQRHVLEEELLPLPRPPSPLPGPGKRSRHRVRRRPQRTAQQVSLEQVGHSTLRPCEKCGKPTHGRDGCLQSKE